MLESQGFGVRLNLKTILLGILYASLSDFKLELAMSSLAVVGSTLNDQYIHSSLPFSSPADALLGSLFVKYKSTVPMYSSMTYWHSSDTAIFRLRCVI